MTRSHGQGRALVRMEWGERGAQAVCAGAGLAVVVDVLSFTTTLSVAVDAGAEVYPFPWNDASAHDFARRNDATLAAGRQAGRPGLQVSLSPASMRAGAQERQRIVLPSPNGSALSWTLRDRGLAVAGAALRNRRAVAAWVCARWAGGGQRTAVAVVAAGERWPDGSLRPAVEDLWGAGAVIAALADLGATGLSAEARTAADAFRCVAGDLESALAACASGAELIERGFEADVAIAAELDASLRVPVLSGERFVNAG